MNYLYMFYNWIKQAIFAIPGRVIALFFFIALFCAPLITKSEYFLGIIVLSTIFALFAVSWDLLSGFTGQLNLGHALFFGVSAYAAGLLNIHLHYSPWITIPLGALVAVAVGLVVGVPALRLRGFYLGLVTLTFPLILLGIFFAFPMQTGGELGISGIDRLASSRIAEYYIVAVIFTVSVLLIWKLTDTKNKVIRLGILLHAIREDEITARASGINTTLQKFIAFALSAFFAGIAGGLYENCHTCGTGAFFLFSSHSLDDIRRDHDNIWSCRGCFHPLSSSGAFVRGAVGRATTVHYFWRGSYCDAYDHARRTCRVGFGQDRD